MSPSEQYQEFRRASTLVLETQQPDRDVISKSIVKGDVKQFSSAPLRGPNILSRRSYTLRRNALPSWHSAAQILVLPIRVQPMCANRIPCSVQVTGSELEVALRQL